jgi:hypothetical protein
MADTIPEDFITHQTAWRAAIEGMIKLAEKSPTFDDDANISYWKHELRTFDNAYAGLAVTDNWHTIECERVHYVDRGVNTILCDRLPSPVTLVIKSAQLTAMIAALKPKLSTK